jgi:D-amino-acid dehydrogenase/Ca-activated chloride channel family protein
MFSLRTFISFLCILSLVSVSACSSTDSTSNKNQETTKTQGTATTDQVKTDINSIIKEGPGSFAGLGKYTEQTFQQQVLDKMSTSMTGKEIYNQLVNNLAERYEANGQAIADVDAIYKFDQNRPEGEQNSQSQAKVINKTHVEILLDASGSMAAKIGGKSKMDLAKEAVKEFASKIQPGTDVSLRVYGHKGGNSSKYKQISCNTTEVVYSPSAYNATQFQAAINQIQPTGWTPITKAIQDTGQKLKNQVDQENMVYIVSDGVESCGGDPVQAAKTLHQSNVKTIVNIIGFDIPNRDKQALAAIAKAGGGEYMDAKTAEDLQRELQRSNTKLWLQWTKWGTNNWLDVQKQFNKKYDVLYKNRREMSVKSLRERKRFDSAKHYLKKNQLISDQAYGELDDLIDNRFSALSDYIKATFNQKYNELIETKKAIQEKISTETKQNKSKYNQ